MPDQTLRPRIQRDDVASVSPRDCEWEITCTYTADAGLVEPCLNSAAPVKELR